jgi:four helix bundle protein
MGKKVIRHQDLEVYGKAMSAAMRVFEMSKAFPKDETYSLTDQIRRSSRSVCANIAEAWRKRRYEKSFVSKIVDTEGEAAETQTWIEVAVRCGYLSHDEGRDLFLQYDDILRTLFGMATHADSWILNNGARESSDAPKKLAQEMVAYETLPF